MALEKTLSIVKPDSVGNNNIGEIIHLLEKSGLKIIAAKMVHLTRLQAESFYAVHKERPFFNDLVQFMLTGPVLVMVLEGENAVSKNREIMGANDVLKVIIDAQEECPRYSCLVIRNVEAKQAPLWMRRRLELCGIASINSLVDVTNYVMLELGQPMHVFDEDVIQGALTIRPAKEKESLLLLDGTSRAIQEKTLIICDKNNPCAVAGVIGGKDSGVSQNTRNIILESAYFLPASVRRSRKALGVNTESSRRFERGCDPNITVKALGYAALLLSRMFPECQLISLQDYYPKPKIPAHVTCRRSRASAVLGIDVGAGEIDNIFERLMFSPSWDNQDTFTTKVPTYRHDIKEEIDLIEEIARVRGFISLQKTEQRQPIRFSSTSLPHHPSYAFEKEIKSSLLAQGLQECITCDLISPKMASLVVDHPISKESLIQVINPMSLDQSILRPSMLPGLVEVVQRNINHRTFDMACFELGNIHLKKTDKFSEQLVCGIILSGQQNPFHFASLKQEVEFLDLKGVVENLLCFIGSENCTFVPSNLSIFHSGRQAKLLVGGLQVGMLGELSPSLLRSLDIHQRVLFAEFDIQDLFGLPKREKKMKELAKFPSSERDWTVTVGELITFEKIGEAIHRCRGPLLDSFSLLDIFRHEKIGKNNKNVTIRFVYRAEERTVSQLEVDPEHQKLIHDVSLLLL